MSLINNWLVRARDLFENYGAHMGWADIETEDDEVLDHLLLILEEARMLEELQDKIVSVISTNRHLPQTLEVGDLWWKNDLSSERVYTLDRGRSNDDGLN